MFARLLLGFFFLACLWLEMRPNGAKSVAPAKPAVPVYAGIELEPVEQPARMRGPKAWIAAGSDALVTKAVVWENTRRLERLQRQRTGFP